MITWWLQINKIIWGLIRHIRLNSTQDLDGIGRFKTDFIKSNQTLFLNQLCGLDSPKHSRQLYFSAVSAVAIVLSLG